MEGRETWGVRDGLSMEKAGIGGSGVLSLRTWEARPSFAEATAGQAASPRLVSCLQDSDEGVLGDVDFADGLHLLLALFLLL